MASFNCNISSLCLPQDITICFLRLGLQCTQHTYIITFCSIYKFINIDLSLPFTFQMGQLPKGITKLWHHDKLSVPLVCVQKFINENCFLVCHSPEIWFHIKDKLGKFLYCELKNLYFSCNTFHL